MEAELTAASEKLKAMKEIARKSSSVRLSFLYSDKNINIYSFVSNCYKHYNRNTTISKIGKGILCFYRKQSILTPGLRDPGTPRYTPKRIGL